MIQCQIEEDKAILTKEQIEKKVAYYDELMDRHRSFVRRAYYQGLKDAYYDILRNFYDEEDLDG